MAPADKTPKEHIISLRNENVKHLTPGALKWLGPLLEEKTANA